MSPEHPPDFPENYFELSLETNVMPTQSARPRNHSSIQNCGCIRPTTIYSRGLLRYSCRVNEPEKHEWRLIFAGATVSHPRVQLGDVSYLRDLARPACPHLKFGKTDSHVFLSCFFVVTYSEGAYGSFCHQGYTRSSIESSRRYREVEATRPVCCITLSRQCGEDEFW